MSNENGVLPKFRPERPIYLNEENTGYKTKSEVVVAIEKLRAQHWLCSYNENSRPFHMSFNDGKEFQKFKKDAADLGVKLKAVVVKSDDDIDFDAPELPVAGQVIPGAEANSSYQDSKGKVHIE